MHCTMGTDVFGFYLSPSLSLPHGARLMNWHDERLGCFQAINTQELLLCKLAGLRIGFSKVCFLKGHPTICLWILIWEEVTIESRRCSRRVYMYCCIASLLFLLPASCLYEMIHDYWKTTLESYKWHQWVCRLKPLAMQKTGRCISLIGWPRHGEVQPRTNRKATNHAC